MSGVSLREIEGLFSKLIHVKARLEDDAQCLVVIIGATPEGKRNLQATRMLVCTGRLPSGELRFTPLREQMARPNVGGFQSRSRG
jgi:hypothetical protein